MDRKGSNRPGLEETFESSIRGKHSTTYELHERKRFHLRGHREELCTAANTRLNYDCRHIQEVGNNCLLKFLA